MSAPTTPATGPRRSVAPVLLAVLAAAVLLAGVVSYYASSSPDGLNRVAEDKGFSALETEHGAADSPLAGYATAGVDDERLSGGLAGTIGVGVTFLLGSGLFVLVRRRSGARS